MYELTLRLTEIFPNLPTKPTVDQIDRVLQSGFNVPLTCFGPELLARHPDIILGHAMVQDISGHILAPWEHSFPKTE